MPTIDIAQLRRILTPGQLFVVRRVYVDGVSLSDVARELSPSWDHGRPDAMLRHRRMVEKRLQRARRRMADRRTSVPV